MAEWIKVEDRLPENCVSVLSFNGFTIQVDFYDESFKSWYSDMGKPLPIVTHWQPLPESPRSCKRFESEVTK